MKWEGVEIDLSTGNQTPRSYPIVLRGTTINRVLSAHEVELRDGTTVIDRIPPSATVGNAYPGGGVEYKKLVVAPDASATGRIKLIIRRAT